MSQLTIDPLPLHTLLTQREDKSQQAPCLSEVLQMEAGDRWQMCYQHEKNSIIKFTPQRPF